MRVEEKTLNESFLEQDWDCVWLSFSHNRFLAQPLLQKLDWKLRGMLTKFFAKPPSTVTFLPTMKRIGPAFIVVENSTKADWEGFYKHCEGLKVKSIGLICDDRGSLEELRKAAARRDGEYPQKVSFLYSQES